MKKIEIVSGSRVGVAQEVRVSKSETSTGKTRITRIVIAKDKEGKTFPQIISPERLEEFKAAGIPVHSVKAAPKKAKTARKVKRTFATPDAAVRYATGSESRCKKVCSDKSKALYRELFTEGSFEEDAPLRLKSVYRAPSKAKSASSKKASKKPSASKKAASKRASQAALVAEKEAVVAVKAAERASQAALVAEAAEKKSGKRPTAQQKKKAGAKHKKLTEGVEKKQGRGKGRGRGKK